MGSANADAASVVGKWLEDLAGVLRLTRKSYSVIRSLAVNPRLASYGSVREVAEIAQVSSGTVTRAAQALGFAGWPALQVEIRAVYLMSLSATEVVAHRQGGQDRPSYSSLVRDRENLGSFLRTIDLRQLARAAEAMASSKRTFVVAVGSFNGIGHILAHTAWLNGYDVRLLSEVAQIPNTIAHLESDDLVIIISFWRIYESAFQAIQSCFKKKIPVILLTESVTRDIEVQVQECIRIPAEGIGFSPSMSTVAAAVNGILAELIAINPERSTRMIRDAEVAWDDFNIMHRF